MIKSYDNIISPSISLDLNKLNNVATSRTKQQSIYLFVFALCLVNQWRKYIKIVLKTCITLFKQLISNKYFKNDKKKCFTDYASATVQS